MKQGVENLVLIMNEIWRLVHEHVVNECGCRAKCQEVGRVLIWRGRRFVGFCFAETVLCDVWEHDLEQQESLVKFV